MTIDKSLIRGFPPMSAVMLPDHSGVLTIGLNRSEIQAASEDEARKRLIGLAQAESVNQGRPVRVLTTDSTHYTVLLIDGDGTVEIEGEPEPIDAIAPATTEPPAPIRNATEGGLGSKARGGEDGNSSAPVVSAPPAARSTRVEVAESSVAAAPPAPVRRRDLREAVSFLAAPTATAPARRGVAGALNRVGFRVAASSTELAERADILDVSRHFTTRRTISVINRKGGANKTPTVVNLAAIFARYGGGGVLAWDNNETMGTLGWRTEPAGHTATVLDVVEHAEELVSTRAEVGQMSQFVHHQPADKFDVLRSDENVDGTHEITADEVDLVHRVMAKYYRLIFMDSGNSDRASNWLRMIDLTDQLVVPATTMEDRAQAALLTLQAVQGRSEKAAELASNAVVVVSEWQAGDSSVARKIADDFRPFVREVVIVPFDPALKGGRIQHDALQPATRRAWLAAAAAVARGL